MGETMLSNEELTERALRAIDRLVGYTPGSSLKGQAVELWSDRAGRLLIVADEADAKLAMQRFAAGRGEVWTPDEIELVLVVRDPADREEVAMFKRLLNGKLSA